VLPAGIVNTSPVILQPVALLATNIPGEFTTILIGVAGVEVLVIVVVIAEVVLPLKTNLDSPLKVKLLPVFTKTVAVAVLVRYMLEISVPAV
jgi:hypothetical protein